MKKLTIFLAFLLFVGFHALAQMQITGTVTSVEDGLSIPGVSVVVKGNATIGTTTNLDGQYSITVPSDAEALMFSFVGMKTKEVAIAGQSVVNVALESEVLEMDEVVVTALGISKERKSLGYTVQDVQGDQLVKAANPNVMTAMSGKIAGVEIRQSSGMPGAPAQVFIRGARAFSGTNTPLYVVDGLPINSENDFVSNVTGSAYSTRALDINPNDIETINVLKGQAAAALYGMRASNGVIVITTKKGSKSQKGKPVVSFSSSYTIDKISLLPDLQQTYAQGTGGNFEPTSSFSWGPRIEDLPDDPVYGGNNYPGRAGEFFDPYKGEWVMPKAYNNAKVFFNNGNTFTNSINISNAGDFGNFALGFGNTNQSGIVDETGMTRYTAKAGGNVNLTESWSVDFSANYSNSEIQKLPSGNDSYLFQIYGSPASYDLMGTPYHQEGAFGEYRQISYRRGLGSNALWSIKNNHFLEATTRFFGNMAINYNPADWALIKYQIGMDAYTTDNEDYIEMGDGDLPTASEYPTPNNPVYAFVQPTGGSIDNYGVTRKRLNSLLTVNLSHDLTDALSAALMLGNEVDDNKSEFYYAQGSGFSVPGYNNLDNCSDQFADYNIFHRRAVGFFGNLNIDYNNMLYFGATGRYDVISSMPNGNRGFFYPSASLGFIFTELGVLESLSFLSFGKIRASYAEVGQAALTYNPYPVYVTGGADSGMLSRAGYNYPFNEVTGFKLSSLVYDTGLKPQNTGTVELGIDLKFFNNKLGLDYTYYEANSKDQIFPVPLAGSTGYSSFMTNAGHLHSVGHELMLYANPVKTRNFNWDINLNFTKSVSTVKELAEGVENINLGGYVTPNIRASAGDTYPAIYGDQYVKDEQGRILINEDPNDPGYGMPMIGEFGKIGEVSPDFILGFTNLFTVYRYVTLSAQIDWKQGGQISSGSNRLIKLYGSAAETEDRITPFIADGYLSDGSKNNIERGGAGDESAYKYYYDDILSNIDEAGVYGTSFVKLREVALSFELPKKWIEPVKLSRASLAFVTRNITLWSELPNFDPESSQGQGNMQGGLDYMSLPQTISYGFNLNLTF